MSEKLYFTKHGLSMLRREVEMLEKELRALQSQTAYVAEVGGNQYHDNSSYELLVVDLRGIDWRLTNAHHRLNHAVAVDTPTTTDIVSIGTRVKITQDGKDITWDIVGFGESDPNRGLLAYNTPIASLIIGRQVGEIISGSISGKYTEIEILEISIGETNANAR